MFTRFHLKVPRKANRKLTKEVQAFFLGTRRPHVLQLRIYNIGRGLGMMMFVHPLLIRVVNSYHGHRGFTYPLRRKERIDGLFCQCHAIRFATQVRKLDPHDGIIFRVEDQGPYLKDTLPNFNVGLTPLQPVAISVIEKANELKLTVSSTSFSWLVGVQVDRHIV